MTTQPGFANQGPAAPPIVVLLVDDQTFVGAALTRILADEVDIQIHCCCEGHEAIAYANRLRPAVILQDLVMPGVDGLSLLPLYRDNPATARTPVVVLSGNDEPVTRLAAQQAGAADYLVKLPHRDVLLSCIRRHALGAEAAAAPIQSTAVASDEHADLTLDPSVLAEFGQAGTAAFTLMLIEQFLQEAEMRVEALRDATRRQDEAALKATAHSLKGSAGIMGAKRLAALCLRLELELESRTDQSAVATMPSIEAEAIRVRRAYGAERKRLSAPVAIPVTTPEPVQPSFNIHS